jgi:hypothetical protein
MILQNSKAVQQFQVVLRKIVRYRTTIRQQTGSSLFNMLLVAENANTDLPPYRFLQRTAIRILIGSKYDG